MSGKPVTSKPVYGYVMDEDEMIIPALQSQ